MSSTLRAYHVTTDRYDLLDRYLEFGFKELSRGSRAIVLTHPQLPTSVVRIAYYDGNFPDPDEGREPHDGWLTYFWNFGRSKSKHLPKIYAVALYANCYVVHLEKLEKCSHQEFEDTGLNAVWNRGRSLTCITIRSLRNFYKRVRDATEHLRVDADFHSGNFMKRSDGTLVMTDPYFID